MADNFTDFYSGNMAPPLKLPGGGYAPTPSAQPQMSPEEIYQGIYGEPLQLTSRSIKTVPVNPDTGKLYEPTVSARAAYAGGIGAGVSGSADVRKKVTIPNPGYGPDPVPKYQERLPAVPAGLPLALPMASARGGLGQIGRGSGSLSLPRAQPSDGIIDLSNLDLSDRGGQAMADSEGKPIRSKSGKVFYPGGKAPSGAASGSLGARDTRGPLGQVLGLKTSGLGGLLSGLFGGGQQQTQQGGGGLAAMLGGGSSIGNSPSQGQAMVVSPGTSIGSTLSSMGFSDGALVPAATIRNLSSKGYI